MRDAYAGEMAIKGAREVYLKKPKALDSEEYDSYLSRAYWYGATTRTIDGMVGFVFRKDPVYEAPKKLDQTLQDVTLNGQTLENFAQETFHESWMMGRVGVLLDYSDKLNRPYFVQYPTEAIINWNTEFIAGEEVLNWVVLKEEVVEPDPIDPFVQRAVPQYRVLRLDNGVYRVQVVTKGRDAFIGQEEVTPTRQGQPLDFIPFFSQTTKAQHITPVKSYMDDLALANISHYQVYADYRDSLWTVGQPMLWLAGFEAKNEIRMGSRKALVTKNADGKAGYLELSGNGLATMVTEIERMEKLMAVLGSRLLEANERGVEAVQTQQIRRAGEESLLSRAVKVSNGFFSTLLAHFGWWAGVTDDRKDGSSEYSVELNRDFNQSTMTPDAAMKLVNMWQANAISYETLYYNLERGELTRPKLSADDETKAIETEEPNLTQESLFEPEPVPPPPQQAPQEVEPNAA